MPAAVRGYSGVVGSGGTTLTIGETSAGPQAGDVRYVFVNSSTAGTATLPSGWTTVFNGQVASGSLAVGYKAWAAGVGTETITFAASTQIGAEIASVSGVDTATAPVVATNGSTTAGTAITTASVTPPSSSGLLVAYFAANLTSGATTGTLSNPAGMVDGEQHPGAAASSYVIRISSVALSSAAATSTYTATASASAASYRTAVIAIPSASSGPTGTANFLPYLGLGTGVSR